jgi:hypothetical protein
LGLFAGFLFDTASESEFNVGVDVLDLGFLVVLD